MMDSTDAELVLAACRGNVNSFGELYCRHYRAAVGIALCTLADRHLAEDAAQETFAVACRTLDRLRSGEKFAAWVGGICRKVARRQAKLKTRFPLPEETPSPAESPAESDHAEEVRLAVHRLPRRAKEVVVLHYFSGLTHEQIAAALGVSPQAVHGRLIRARRKIADDLRRNGFPRSES
jgi:RNA polymerase sigma-70 factor, ECF subfamily